MAIIQDYIDRQLPTTPKEEIGIGGFTALVRMRERYALTAEIPATPVENGAVVHDHVILKPVVITIEGNVSDVYKKPSETIRQFQRVQAEIGNVTSQYAPERTQTQLSKISALANDAADAVRRIDNLIATGDQIANLFGNRDTDTKGNRETFIDTMEAYYYAGTPISIDMPYRRFDMMIITSFVVSYDNEIDATGFSLEVQKLTLAELEYSKLKTPAAGLNGQTKGIADKGAQAGKPVSSSIIYSVLN